MKADRRAAERCRNLFRGVLCALFLGLLLTGTRAAAAGDVLLRDSAGIFKESEKEQMRETARELAQDYNINVLLLTSDQYFGYGRTSVMYMEDLYEDEGYAENGAKGGLLFLIDMDNRELLLVTDGIAMRFITDSREEAIYDAAYGPASVGDYGGAMLAMLYRAANFMEQGIPGGQYLYDSETGRISRYRSLTPVEIGFSALAAFLTAFIVTTVLKSRYKKVKPYEYAVGQNANCRITAQRDDLANQFVTRRRLPRANIPTGGGGGRSRGGGGGTRTTTHRSSGGRSYGGGHGRKF